MSAESTLRAVRLLVHAMLASFPASRRWALALLLVGTVCYGVWSMEVRCPAVRCPGDANIILWRRGENLAHPTRAKKTPKAKKKNPPHPSCTPKTRKAKRRGAIDADLPLRRLESGPEPRRANTQRANAQYDNRPIPIGIARARNRKRGGASPARNESNSLGSACAKDTRHDHEPS